MSSEKSSEYAIEVKDLSKCYQIYDKPVDRLKQMLMHGRKQYFKEFWALKNVSFKIKKGETVGIIGRNGSGKSTLLQMICGTLNPTAGELKSNGRVAALLELGAGFNPEFTGLENVYMAASLYGLNSKEIESRLNAIIEFADIGDKLYLPVKTYSSGMYVRLAFSVIANVDAEILIIDEALAVGDAIFTQKCMRFIRNFKRSGTLLFVSHDMNAVLNLCDKALWLDLGQVQSIGESKKVSELYLQHTLQKDYGTATKLESIRNSNEDSQLLVNDSPAIIDYKSQYIYKDNLKNSNGWMTGFGEIIEAKLINIKGQSDCIFEGGETVIFSLVAKANNDIANPILGFMVKDRLGQDLFGENTLRNADKTPKIVIKNSIIKAQFEFKLPMLQNGEYSITASLASGTQESHVQLHWLNECAIITVSSSLVRWGIVGINFSKVEMT